MRKKSFSLKGHFSQNLTSCNLSNSSSKLNQNGQALVEFLLLLAVLFGLSLILLKGVNGYLGDLWLYIAKILAYPAEVNYR